MREQASTISLIKAENTKANFLTTKCTDMVKKLGPMVENTKAITEIPKRTGKERSYGPTAICTTETGEMTNKTESAGT